MSLSLGARDVYQKPDYEALPFPERGFSSGEEAKGRLLDGLASVARDFDVVPMSSRSRAIAIARRLDPLHKDSFVADYQLSRGVTPEPVLHHSSIEDLLEKVSGLGLQMVDSPDSDEKLLGIYLVSLFSTLDPENAEFTARLVEGKSQGLVPQWDSVYASSKVSSIGEVSGSLRKVSLLSTSGAVSIGSTAKEIGSGLLQFSGGDKLGTDYFDSAFREGVKYLGVKKSGAVRGIRIQFSVDSDQTADFFGAQGPATALPCLVNLHSHLENSEVDLEVLFAGDVNADGTIQPLHDIRERLVGLGSEDSRIIGIPHGDANSLSDLLILYGPTVFAKHQIFALKRFEEALDLGAPSGTREAKLEEAISKFSELQGVLNQAGGVRHLAHPATIERLKEVMALAPHHGSSRMLGLWATGRAPRRLTLAASLDLVMEATGEVVDLGGDRNDKNDKEKVYEAGKSMEQLRKLLDHINPQLTKLANASIQCANAGRIGDNRSAIIRQAETRVRDELDAVMRNPAIRETLMR